MVIILLLQSMLVVYSLLLSNTEEKTYEYGMLRALGMRHHSLIQLLTVQVNIYHRTSSASLFSDISYLKSVFQGFLLKEESFSVLA